jgi:hypothetical protein
MLACSKDDRGGGEVDIDGREASQVYSDLCSDVEVEMRSRLCQEGDSVSREKVE